MSCNKQTTEKELYELAVKYWGETPQLLKTIEELSELSRAISRYLIMTGGENIAKDADHWNEDLQLIEIFHEIVDVEIMIGQIKANFYNSEPIHENARDIKFRNLRRLLELEGADIKW